MKTVAYCNDMFDYEDNMEHVRDEEKCRNVNSKKVFWFIVIKIWDNNIQVYSFVSLV